MYRIKILSIMVFSVILAIAAFQYYQMPTDPNYYARAVSKFMDGLEREYGKSAVAAVIFSAGIFSFMMLKRRS